MSQEGTISGFEPSGSDLALTLGGGGARAAYQAGVLRGLVRVVPTLAAPYLTGISAGAINAAHLANHPGSLVQALEDLDSIWRGVQLEDVFEAQDMRLFVHAAKVAWRAAFGRPPLVRAPRGLVDTKPLEASLCRWLGAPDGVLRRIDQNLASGSLRAVALTTTSYSTGQTVTFFAGQDIEAWERPQRRAVRAELTVAHVMASAALPLFFPPVEIDGKWYGDGGVRLVAPLAPALHLGASKLLAISTRYARSRAEADMPVTRGEPAPARILGVLFNAVFLDQLDQDAMHLERINHLLHLIPEEQRGTLRPVGLFVIRPSIDLGELASEYEVSLPLTFRSLTRRLGTKRDRSQDLLSTVMFQQDYLTRLIEIGEHDGERQGPAFANFLAAPAPTTHIVPRTTT